MYLIAIIETYKNANIVTVSMICPKNDYYSAKCTKFVIFSYHMYVKSPFPLKIGTQVFMFSETVRMLRKGSPCVTFITLFNLVKIDIYLKMISCKFNLLD